MYYFNEEFWHGLPLVIFEICKVQMLYSSTYNWQVLAKSLC